MSTATAKYAHLEPNPKSAYRQLFIKGTRIPARAVYSWYASDEPMSPKEIATDFGIPVEAVHEAIVYCESRPPELLEDYARQAASMEAMGLNAPDYNGNPKPISTDDRAHLRRR
jgi:uncharacterized protein (DUF433 family)